ncbi:hypothetical protein JKP88DRAFT_221535 [Tribonema minus]|uniref:Uncharacterized protein n=1 Tax=Tribonema minus TaxID=303371 RepID=A0A836CFN9_9STRA|nr:hypothetical protein JKP88DRAFT_221535 [Tribonema minus]
MALQLHLASAPSPYQQVDLCDAITVTIISLDLRCVAVSGVYRFALLVAVPLPRRTATLAARADGISAKGALEADQFLFLQRQTRSNKLSEAMVAVIVEFWHSEEVRRGNGNTSDVKKASKHRDAAQHPAQVQIRTAAEAYGLLHESSDYQAAGRTSGEAGGKVSYTVFQLHTCWRIGQVSTRDCSFNSRCDAAVTG